MVKSILSNMKKTYSAPIAKFVNVNARSLVCVSPGYSLENGGDGDGLPAE